MKKNQHHIDKSFVSEYDLFLAKFDQTHPLSPSQLAERRKHEKIAYLRDQVSEVQDNI